MIGAAFFFSLMTVFVKLLGEDIPTAEIILIRSLFAAGVTYILLVRARIKPLGNDRLVLSVRGAVGFCALLCFFYAIPRLPLAEVTVLQYLNPIFVAIFAGVFLKEALGRREVVCVILGILGVILIARPKAILGMVPSDLNTFALGAVLCGAVLSAVAYVLVRKLTATEHPLVIVLYFPLFCIPLSIPFMSGASWPSNLEWIYLIGIGITAQIAQMMMTWAYRMEKAATASATSYVQMVFAAGWGLLLFNELPTVWLVSGAGLIVAGILLLAYRPSVSEPALS